MALQWPVAWGGPAWAGMGAIKGRWARLRSVWRQPSWVCLVPAVDAVSSPLGVPVHDQALLQWRAWCEARPGQRARLGLSARWLLSVVVPLVGSGSAARRQAIDEAELRWAQLLGLDGAAWRERWTTRAVSLSTGVLVCAAPRALLDDLTAVARHHHVLVQWIGPWWTNGVQPWLAAGQDHQERALTLWEPGWRVHAQAQGTALAGLRAEPAFDQDGVQPAGDDVIALTPSQEPGRSQATEAKPSWWAHCLPARAEGWSSALNFAPGRTRAAPWAWALLLAGLASVLWMADQVDALQAQQIDAQAQLKRLARADRLARVERAALTRATQAPPPQAAASAPTLAPAAADEAVGMVRALAFPWPAVLTRMERSASAAGVVMLSMSTSLDDVARAAGPTWRLQAAVRDDAAALGWADSLPDGRLISRASLSTPFTTSQGPYSLKVEVQASSPWALLMESLP